eukprot:Skav224531  [mRNA]  locus=scaffold388:552895:554745:+ [translate_table: standard]
MHTLQLMGMHATFLDFVIYLHDIAIPWLEISFKTLKRLLHHQWIQHLSTHDIDRKHFDLQGFDVYANQLAFRKLDYLERGIVEQYFTGRYFTHDLLSKFVPAITPQCPMCGETDGREHRLFHCTALKKFRHGFRRIKSLQNLWATGNWYFGLCPEIPMLWEHLRVWTAGTCQFTVPLESPDLVHIFVDGSAHFGDVQPLTISAAAWMRADYGVKICLDSGRQLVPGLDHSSFAAELYAILLVLNKFWCVTIYSDCSAVCDLVQYAIDNPDIDAYNKCGLHLFWKLIQDHVRRRPPGCISITKVRSHQDISAAISSIDAWLIWGNDFADREAKAVFSVDHALNFRRASKVYKQVLQHRKDICELYQFVATTGLFQLKLQREQKPVNIEQPAFVPESINELQFPRRGSAHFPQLSEDHFRAFPWGPVFLWRIMFWLRRLRWDTAQVGMDVSFLEMYVDFCLTTNSRAPRNVFTRLERQKFACNKFALFDLEPRADAATCSLAQQSGIWVRALTWLHNNCPGVFFPANIIPRSMSLNKIGSSFWYKGFNRRPILVNRHEPARVLHGYFCTERGTVRNLSRVLDIHFDGDTVTHPAALELPFEACVAFIRVAKDHFSSFN